MKDKNSLGLGSMVGALRLYTPSIRDAIIDEGENQTICRKV